MVQLKAVYMVKDISRLSQFYQIPINPPSVSVNTLCELLVKYMMLGDLKSEPVGHSSCMLQCELKETFVSQACHEACSLVVLPLVKTVNHDL